MDKRLNWVKLIKTFIMRFDYEHITLEDIKMYDQKRNSECTISLELDNGELQRETIQFNNDQKIWQIVLQISKKFKLKVSEFKIVAKGGPIDEKIYYD